MKDRLFAFYEIKSNKSTGIVVEQTIKTNSQQRKPTKTKDPEYYRVFAKTAPIIKTNYVA